MKLVIRAPHRADRLQQFLSAERISIFSGEREWPSWEVPSLRDVLVAPPCLGLAHLESPTADVNTPSRKQKQIGGDHGADNRHYVRPMCGGSFRLQAQALPGAEAAVSTLSQGNRPRTGSPLPAPDGVEEYRAADIHVPRGRRHRSGLLPPTGLNSQLRATSRCRGSVSP